MWGPANGVHGAGQWGLDRQEPGARPAEVCGPASGSPELSQRGPGTLLVGPGALPAKTRGQANRSPGPSQQGSG